MNNSGEFSKEERAAMKERTRELKAQAGSNRKRANGEAEVVAKIGEMSEPERVMATRIHGIILAAAPGLLPRAWYGMPAYSKDGKVVCFFQSAKKFSTRYATLGFSDQARLDGGGLWPTSFALTRLTGATEGKIADLVKKAVG